MGGARDSILYGDPLRDWTMDEEPSFFLSVLREADQNKRRRH